MEIGCHGIIIYNVPLGTKRTINVSTKWQMPTKYFICSGRTFLDQHPFSPSVMSLRADNQRISLS